MLDANQPLITLSAACRGPIKETLGRQIAPATAYRWVRNGLLADDGTRVRLPALKLGRTYMTSTAAVADFFEEIALRAVTQTPSTAMQNAATEAKLKAAGLYSCD